jgi:Chaperone of endosialidase
LRRIGSTSWRNFIKPGPEENQKKKITMKRQNLIHILIGIVCIGLLPKTQAVSPAPDGGYANGNTAEGQNALFSLTTGVWNTAIGTQSLYHITTSSYNTATGFQTLFGNTTGRYSVANGAQALFNNTSGSYNTATGFRALYANTSGTDNTCDGFTALVSNTGGSENTAYGVGALHNNTIGGDNVAVGNGALYLNTTGFINVAIGEGALFANTTGHDNNAYGIGALDENTSGNYNIALGELAGELNATGSNNIYIGDIGGQGGELNSNVIAIGNKPLVGSYEKFFVGAVFGVTTESGSTLPVIVSDDGQLGTAPSAARFKKEIKAMDKVSESVLALKPVTFRYKSDKTSTPQFGLVAEEVANVNPDLVVRDKNGEIYTVRYDAVNAMLLNEFLKEHRKVQELQATLAEQQKSFESKLAGEQKQIDALTAGLQKVSAQLEATKPAPQVVNNTQ